jgi:hypothetical protein
VKDRNSSAIHGMPCKEFVSSNWSDEGLEVLHWIAQKVFTGSHGMKKGSMRYKMA